MTPQTLLLSDGVTRYLEAGSGAPVLLLHGVGLCAAAWGPQIAALSGKHRVIALNMPGHGGSALLPGTPGLQDFVGWAADAIGALQAGPVAVAGHSMGAMIAAGLAIDHPTLVSRVALLNGVFLRSETARAAVAARAEAIANGAVDIDAPLSRWFDEQPAERVCRDQVARWLHEVNPAGYAAAYRAFAGGDRVYSSQFGLISCPLLALTGEGDANSTPEMAREMAAAVQNGRAVVIGGHRHMVNLTAPEAVNAALADWLDAPAKAQPTPERAKA